jgi:(p)ppGpp synthase/HD superfamily hydrolase
MSPAALSQRFEEALNFCVRLHSQQRRKGTHVPYIAHLLAVTALVLEDGGDEDLVIAALLHDAVEDQGGLDTLQMIRIKFGDRVADIVDGCTDSYTVPKLPWRERKERYLDHLQAANLDVLRVSLADKLHNSRSILRDLRLSGDDTWSRFNGGKEGTLWYYRELAAIFIESDLSSQMVEEFIQTVLEIEDMV